ncbi:HEAT repeat domain-containing protein, partial [bacterium]|nr:HEAT repeat domain-containing protein [bacterium]
AIAAMDGASVPARAALLRILARIGGDAADGALRTSVKDGNSAIREAGVRAMAEFGDSGLAPDLLALARKAPTPALGVLALRGYWRLVGEADAKARLALCEAGLAASARPEEKKLGLTQLANVPHPKALALAESLAKDPAVRAEAEAACVQIAASLVGSHPSEARAALTGLKANAKNPRARTEAAKALDAMERYVGYISTWQVAGPYRQKGKECQQLFDIAFDPEKADAKVAWKPAPRPNDASLAWKVDLSSVVGGTHCVVYVRSRVHAPAKQTVRLDMGADDGIKVWIGGKLVHANNAIRALTPEQDRASAVLEQGWNDVLVKITQHTQGCEACIRIRKPDGAVVDGLRFGTGE